jgi:hypothetical protein
MQVNDEYMKTLETLSKKIKFIDADPMVKSSKALKDVQPEVERLRQKAVSKVWKTIFIFSSCWHSIVHLTLASFCCFLCLCFYQCDVIIRANLSYPC